MNEGLEVRCASATHVNPIVNGAQQLPIFNLIFLLRFFIKKKMKGKAQRSLP